MKILALKEKNSFEKRIAITPEIVAKYKKIGYEVFVEEGLGNCSMISDEDFIKSGAKIISNNNSFSDFDILLKVSGLESDDIKKLSSIKKDAILIGMLNPYFDLENIKNYHQFNLKAFAMELMPRITRAQSMDVLSSQSNLAGYRSVIEASYHLNGIMPMMMTAAGTISPAKTMILGVGVAGLQAIATAKRLGSIVVAFDVRPAAKEQVESLGAKFIEVKNENSSTKDMKVYAKEMDEDYKKKQEQAIYNNIIKQNIVITTAMIQGKSAPKLINEEMVKNMIKGSVIIDLATSSGGNCELTKKGEIVEKYGVKIIGYDLISKVSIEASKLYCRNLFNFVEFITDAKQQVVKIDPEDEIVKATLLKS